MLASIMVNIHIPPNTHTHTHLADVLEPASGDPLRLFFDITFFFIVIVILLAIMQGWEERGGREEREGREGK